VQWKEASFTDSRGDVFRVYTVCNVDATVVDNWLRLPFIRVRPDVGGDADSSPPVRVYVELRFTMRRCVGYPACRESFKLLAYDAATPVGNARRPTWDDRTYRTVGVVAADRVFADTADTSAVNTERRALQVQLARGQLITLLLFFFDPGTQFPGNEKNCAMQYKKVQKSSWNKPYSSSSFTK